MKYLAPVLILLLAFPSAALACAKPGYAKANTFLGAVQLGETAIDCSQTVTILHRPGGYEGDNLVPAIVTRENRAAHPGLCMAAGAGLVGIEYLVLHCKSPFYMTLITVGEGINIQMNYQLLRGK